MGLQTVEEIEDVPDMWIDAKPVEDVFAPGRHKLQAKRIKSKEETFPTVNEGDTQGNANEDDGYAAAFAKLLLIYDGNEDAVDRAFSAEGVGYSAPDLKKDEKDPEIRKVAVKVSSMF